MKIQDYISPGELQYGDFDAIISSRFEDVPIAMAQLNDECQFTSINNQFIQLTGYAETELLNLKFYELAYPADIPAISGIMSSDSGDKNASQPVEIRLIDKNSNILWCRFTIQNEPGNNGNQKKFIAIIENITSQKYMENELSKIKGFNKNIIESSNDCIKVLDEDNRLIFMSKSGQKTLGIENMGSVLEMDYCDFWEGSDVESVKTAITMARKGRTSRFQGYCPTVDNTPKWWDVSVSPMQQPDGSINNLLVISRDITEQKLSADSLKKSEEKYRNLFAFASDPIFIIDFENKRFIDANSIAIEKIGYSREELSTFTVEKITAPMNELRKHAIAKELEEKGSVIYEHVFLRKDGTPMYAEISSRIIEYGERKVIQCFIRDITDRKQTEDRLIWELAINSSLTALSATAIDPQISLNEVADLVLEKAKALTDSETGYVSSLTPGSKPCADMQDKKIKSDQFVYFGDYNFYLLMQKKSRKTQKMTHPDFQEPFYINNMEDENIIIQVNNEPQVLRNILNVPVMAGNRIMGTIVLANSFENYNESSIQLIQRMAALFALSIQRQCYEESLKKTNDLLEQRVLERTEELSLANICLKTEINEREIIENALIESEKLLKEAQKISHLGHWKYEIGSNRLYWSDETFRIFGLEPQQYVADYNLFLKFVHPEDRDYVDTLYSESLKNHIEYDLVHRIKLENGDIKYVHEKCHTDYDVHGNPIQSIGTILDITELKLSEEKLKASLEEKQALIKEIHDRVKNNMQVISSLVNLQAMQIEDREGFNPGEAYEMLMNTKKRIFSMALIHEKLYRSENMAFINFKEYTDDLVQELHNSFNNAKTRIKTSVKIDNIHLALDSAVPCGLLINEIITNSFKYAFPGGRKGTISISLQKNNNTCILNVSDDGIGLPEDVDFNSHTTLGFELIHSLTTQLKGTIDKKVCNGTHYTVTFPVLDKQMIK